MTPADRRITELIDKWLASIDLHLQYVELSDAAYARAQAWPKHDRPTRWVLEVARQKILELKAQCETRQAMGDSRFSESLELMAFLANLVGIQHIQRFIPLADAVRGQPASTSQTVEALPPARPPAQQHRPAGDHTTGEMQRLRAAAAAKAPNVQPARTPLPVPQPPRVTSTAAGKGRSDGGRPVARAAPARHEAAAAKFVLTAELRGKILADAVRLLKWGKPWHELAELIERIAERPPAAEIRKVLRAHKGEIEERAAQG